MDRSTRTPPGNGWQPRFMNAYPDVRHERLARQEESERVARENNGVVDRIIILEEEVIGLHAAISALRDAIR